MGCRDSGSPIDIAKWEQMTVSDVIQLLARLFAQCISPDAQALVGRRHWQCKRESFFKSRATDSPLASQDSANCALVACQRWQLDGFTRSGVERNHRQGSSQQAQWANHRPEVFVAARPNSSAAVVEQDVTAE